MPTRNLWFNLWIIGSLMRAAKLLSGIIFDPESLLQHCYLRWVDREVGSGDELLLIVHSHPIDHFWRISVEDLAVLSGKRAPVNLCENPNVLEVSVANYLEFLFELGGRRLLWPVG